MNILIIHQNFPGQFKHLAPVLVQRGHDVRAFTMQKGLPATWQGVKMVPYEAGRSSSKEVHPWVADFETKVIRGEACYRAAMQLKESGYVPDVIIAHPGWGESLFMKDVWPEVRLGIYCEFFYIAEGGDVGFDLEFPSDYEGSLCRLRLKNLNNLVHFQHADVGISPTAWQASTFPEAFRPKISVIHDGIDTQKVQPHPDVSILLNDNIKLTRQDEVITFVNRNLEPLRGYHVLMRALPELLKRRPNARVLIVGGDGISYGAKPKKEKNWKLTFLKEVRPLISDEDWKRVHFLGNIPYQQFIPLLQLSTVHLYLTYPFVLSWSLLEAMSAGCAIVASDTSPLREVIEHGKTGRLVDFFDAGAIVNEISDLLDHPDERERLGASAREFVVQNYDLASVCLPQQIAWVEHTLGGLHHK